MSELRWILIGCGLLLLGGIVLWGRRSRGQAAASELPATRVRQEPLAEPADDDVLTERQDHREGQDPVASRWAEEEWTDTVADLPEIRLDSAPDSAPFDVPRESEAGEWAAADAGVVTEPNVDVPSGIKDADQTARAEPTPAPAAQPSRTPAKAEKRKIIALRLSANPPDRYPGAKLRSALESLGLRHGRYGIFHLHDSEGASVISVASMVEPGAFDLATMADSPFAGITLFAMLPGPLAGNELCDQIFDCARRLEGMLGGSLFDERGAPLTVERLDAIRDEVLDFEHLLGAAPRHA